MKYFRVKYGYGKNDYYTIDEYELKKALVAQKTGTVVSFKEGTLSGRSIISIRPDIHRIGGFYPDHELSAEDMQYISKRSVIDHENFIEKVTGEIGKLPSTNNLRLT